MITKGFMIEQVKRRINGGNPSTPVKFKDEDISIAICNEVNGRLKVDYLNTLAMGETIPEGSQLMVYTGDAALTPVKYGACYSYIQLPCMPVKLIRDMGVYHVSRDQDEGNPFIPVLPGQAAMYMRQKGLLNELQDLVPYEVNGTKVIFHKDLSAEQDVKVMVKLIVNDIFSLGDWDLMPVTAEMFADIVQVVFEKLTNAPQQDKTVDVTTVK